MTSFIGLVMTLSVLASSTLMPPTPNCSKVPSKTATNTQHGPHLWNIKPLLADAHRQQHMNAARPHC